MPPPCTPHLSRSFWLLQKTVVPPHLRFSTALPHSHLHFLSWLSSISFNSSCHTCYSLVFPLPPHVSFPSFFVAAQTSSKCTASHELSTCFGHFFPAWRSATVLFFLKTSQSDAELVKCHKINEPIPCLSVRLDSVVHECLDISFTFM